MTLSEEKNHRTEIPLYNSRILKNYVEYLKDAHPKLDLDLILSHAGITSYQIEDQGHWFTQSQTDRFQEILIKETGDPHLPRKVGRYAASSKASGTLRQYALGFTTPASAYRMLEKLASNLSRAFTLKVTKIAHNKVEVTVKPNPDVKEKPYQCENRLGLFESIAKLFTGRFAKVEHPVCLQRGGEVGVYQISWQEGAAATWKRIRNYSLLFGILVTLVLFFVLPIKYWALVSLLFALITLTFSFYSSHLEKTDLLKTLETQGDAAKDHLEEMNIRYNNALLIQEIGQATSTILDIDKLIWTVVSAMEKRLDFDRGMIMLANKERTRLVYRGGYGYSKGQERLLEGTEFHLDKPDGRGVFVTAFKIQKPILHNNISENGKTLSKRSLELAQKMGVQSLICVPIVYEKESFGILAVDNVKSKRVLTQSDMSLLMGVAWQTAVNIIEAKSFQRLQESEKKYRDLVENANSIILRMNINGYITFFNEFAQRFFEYTEDEILGENIAGTLLPRTEATKRDFEELTVSLRQQQDRNMITENQYLLRNGKTAWIAWTYKPVFNNDGEFTEILCIGNDITELKYAEKEKKTLEDQLQGAQKMEAIGTLAGGIAHDFNNILQAIIGYTQILLMAKESSDPDYEKLQAIEASAQRASELTQRLLVFGRKVESQLKPVDLKQEVIQVSKMLERTIPKMIEIELRLAENTKIINADPVQIEQIMMNLGVNARDAMPEGGKLTFETENIIIDEAFCITHLGSKPGEYVRLRVSDNGIGMEKDLQEHIFEPFFTTKETGKGTGLGLAMVYGIVKSHSGYITCESQPDRGTAFSIYFPVLKNKKEESRSKEAEIPIKGGNETILIVDDEESIRRLGTELLTHFGYTVTTAPDGETALDIYDKNNEQIDLVILDLNMPGMGGLRCLEKLIKMNPKVKVIVASGYSRNGPTRDVIKLGAKGFVGKPYEVKEMLRVIRETINPTDRLE